MNMSPKILKKAAVSESSAISIPVFRQDVLPSVEPVDFAIPSIENIKLRKSSVGKPFSKPTVEDVLQNAKDEADQIITQAENNKEMIEKAAHEKGMQEVQKLVDEQVSQQIADFRKNLSETLEKVSTLHDDLAYQVESDLVKLSIEIAKKIVAREVNVDNEIALKLVKVSLKRLDSRIMAEVRLHPNDFAFIQDHREGLDSHSSLKLIEDSSISKGGCLIHTETGDIDAKLESQFEEIAKGLLEN